MSQSPIDLTPDDVHAVRRGPVRIRLVSPTEPIDVNDLTKTLRSAGLDCENLPPEAMAQMAERLPALVEQLLADPTLAQQFDEDPGVLRETLGDDVTNVLVELRWRAGAARSRRIVEVVDPAGEELVTSLRNQIVEWILRHPDNLAAFRSSPAEVVRRVAADAPPTVVQALLDIYEPTEGASDA